MTALDKLPSPGYIALAVACVVAYLFTGTLVSTIGITLVLGLPLYFMSDLPPYATWSEKFGQYIFLLICTMIFIFLITPVLIWCERYQSLHPDPAEVAAAYRVPLSDLDRPDARDRAADGCALRQRDATPHRVCA